MNCLKFSSLNQFLLLLFFRQISLCAVLCIATAACLVCVSPFFPCFNAHFCGNVQFPSVFVLPWFINASIKLVLLLLLLPPMLVQRCLSSIALACCILFVGESGFCIHMYPSTIHTTALILTQNLIFACSSHQPACFCLGLSPFFPCKPDHTSLLFS